MNISIVIPNYQGKDVLPETLEHLKRALESCSLETEVIVTDDASTDGSADWAASQGIHVVRRKTNGGFGLNCMSGAAAATGSLIYFLNSDAHAHRGFLEPLVEHFSDPATFAAGSMTVNSHGVVQQPTLVIPKIKRGQIRLDNLLKSCPRTIAAWQTAGPCATLYACGGSVLFDRKRFMELGGFADIFAPFYYEDVDIGWRAWRRRWRSVFDPRSVVTHEYGTTIDRTHRERAIDVFRKRNRFILLWRNTLADDNFVRRHLLRIPAHLAGRLLRGDWAPAMGFYRALADRQEVAAHRCAEAQHGGMSNAELDDLLEGERQRMITAFAANMAEDAL